MAVAILKKSQGGADNIVWTNGTGASKAAGMPFVVEEEDSNLKGVAMIPLNTIANLATGTVYTKGEFTITKDDDTEFSIGETVYFDESADQADDVDTATADGDFVLGYCTEAATSAVSYVDFALNEGPDAYTVVS